MITQLPRVLEMGVPPYSRYLMPAILFGLCLLIYFAAYLRDRKLHFWKHCEEIYFINDPHYTEPEHVPFCTRVRDVLSGKEKPLSKLHDAVKGMDPLVLLVDVAEVPAGASRGSVGV